MSAIIAVAPAGVALDLTRRHHQHRLGHRRVDRGELAGEHAQLGQVARCSAIRAPPAAGVGGGDDVAEGCASATTVVSGPPGVLTGTWAAAARPVPPTAAAASA